MPDPLIKHYEKRPTGYYSPIGPWFIRKIQELHGIEIVGNVLDVGCGDGRLAGVLPFPIWGMDYTKARIEAAQRMYPESVWVEFDITGKVPDAFTGFFDVVCVFEVLEHLSEPVKALQRCLAFAPLVVGSVPIDMPYEAHRHVYQSEDQVADELAPDQIHQISNHYTMTWLRNAG